MGGSITNRIRLDQLQLPALKLILKKNILPYTRLGRLIEPSEIAEAICFLISNSEVSGQLWADADWHPPFLNSKSPPVK
jgi:NAD(P)-dependent dehydrogenase (short-subunit alcohol dehydrogenase family)